MSIYALNKSYHKGNSFTCVNHYVLLFWYSKGNRLGNAIKLDSVHSYPIHVDDDIIIRHTQHHQVN